ncbi:zinc finger, CCHC-type containing protein [Tanacetum coccineum]
MNASLLDMRLLSFMFYVIEPNELVSINSIIESRDAIFDENRFSSVPRSCLEISNGTEDISGSVVLEEVTKEGCMSQLGILVVTGCLMYAMTCTRPDIAFAVGKLSSWVSLLYGGAIYWASKKQTCVTNSIMEFEFLALATAGKEAKWLMLGILSYYCWFKIDAAIED